MTRYARTRRSRLALAVALPAIAALSPVFAGEPAAGPAAAPAAALRAENERLKEEVEQQEARIRELLETVKRLEATAPHAAPKAPAEKLEAARGRLEKFAADYYLRGDCRGAWPLLKSAVDLGSEDPETFFRLAYCYEAISEHGAAIGYYRKAAEGFAGDQDRQARRVDALNNLATIQRRLGKAGEAAKTLAEITRLAPDYAPVFFNLAVLYERDLEEPQKAIQAYRRHILLGGDRGQSAEAAIKRILEAPKEKAEKEPAGKPAE
jgi:Tfp pilus assembly protein PilF